MKTGILTTTAAALLFVAPALAQAEALRYNTTATAGWPGTAAMIAAAERLAADEAADLKLEIFHSSQLGDETETIKQVARGRIDLGGFSITAAATVVPEVSIVISPYFWNNADEAMCAISGGLGEALEPYFEAKGLKPLLWHDLGWQIFFAKDAIVDPAEAKGYKMRISPAQNHLMYWKAVEAAGIPLPFTETASGLQTSIVDGGETTLTTYVATGMGKLAPHLMLTNHVYQPLILLMSAKSWNALSPEQQAELESALPDVNAVNAELRDYDKALIGRFESEGGILHELTDEQRAKWAAVWTEEDEQKLVASIGGDAQKVYEAAVAARTACRN
ncbi:TRAP transporter substrate-binding protein [Seohaeicola zhoushanensis]|uniref:ABC transporter substrate-binding protein n=1 Tax=Seohaeicola zhoushanensis TaxID=1569283 RepID=A0A8J3GVI6_9RHOB|nr:TRAP transporter substrate-binding protein [Seohaeicola zhoushanensis]GHF39722.1 ABC transporter substrate-binding protein [Seohaeicola zhoushanensis]